MQNPFKNKFIVNFHHADFDGAISGTCAKIALGNDLISKSYSILKVPDAIIKIIDDIDILLLTDLNVYGEKLDILLPYIQNNKLIIYDHHLNPHSTEIFNNYMKNSFNILDDNMSGSLITWSKLKEYYPTNNQLINLQSIVNLSNCYDMWDINNPDFEYASSINDLLDYKIGYNPDQFRERFIKNPDPFDLSNEEKMIIERKKLKHIENLKNLKKNAALFDYKDHTFVMVESPATNYTKMHFMNEIIENEHIDMFIFKYPSNVQCSVRIPENSKILDLNNWYEEFGCVGHAKAGGISVNEYYKFKKVLEQI